MRQAANRKGPRKLKSWPLLAAQNVYIVRLKTTTNVSDAASIITPPVWLRQEGANLVSIV